MCCARWRMVEMAAAEKEAVGEKLFELLAGDTDRGPCTCMPLPLQV